MKLSELIDRLQKYKEQHGDMDFVIEALNENVTKDWDDAWITEEFVELFHDRDERGTFGGLRMKRSTDS